MVTRSIVSGGGGGGGGGDGGDGVLFLGVWLLLFWVVEEDGVLNICGCQHVFD